MYKKYTIISQITPLGYSGVGIIRISGSLSLKIINIILKKKKIKPRYAYYINFKNIKGNILDKGIALWFPKPYSYTGEDVLELHAHGGQLIINLIIQEILNISKNIQIAKPGEFTERAFLNNKIDLLQAESINTIINNNHNLSLPYIINNINGNSSKFINSLLKKIFIIEIIIENILNFENEEFILNEFYIKIKKYCLGINNILKRICNANKENNIFNKNINFTIIGPPNSGKSSLFNSLLEKEKAIVTNIKGTTRDILSEIIKLNNFDIILNDTAGLRYTNNIIEKIGIKYTYKQLLLTDYIFYVLDITKNSILSLEKNYFLNKILNKTNKKIFIILNKRDLLLKKNFKIKKIYINNKLIEIIYLSTFYKSDIVNLKKYVYKIIINNINKNYNLKFLFQERHIFCFNKAFYHFNKINKLLNNTKFINDIIAHELTLGKRYLEEIIGKHITSKEILNKIFRNFCIGK